MLSAFLTKTKAGFWYAKVIHTYVVPATNKIVNCLRVDVAAGYSAFCPLPMKLRAAADAILVVSTIICALGAKYPGCHARQLDKEYPAATTSTRKQLTILICGWHNIMCITFQTAYQNPAFASGATVP